MSIMPSVPIEEYQVGVVCALPKEMRAARAMLDEEYKQLKIEDARDNNSYVFGQIHEHNVVIACLPAGVYGTVAAATVASNMLRTFKGLRFGLMMGIGGGIPNMKKGLDIRLGDIVVSQPDDIHGGVVQYDLGKSLDGGMFIRKGSLDRPPSLLLTAVSSLQSQRGIQVSQVPMYLSEMDRKYPDLKDEGYVFPGVDKDHLHCTRCDPSRWWWILWWILLWFLPIWRCEVCENGKVLRRSREPGKPVVHYGTIASGNQVVKDPRVRDRLGQEFGALCVEMEAAGLMNDFPGIVIRGICDYADSHKNDLWQEYAALVAAAYAKELLSVIRPTKVVDAKCVTDTMSESTKVVL
jgi:nucleoside phosphorylase